MNQKEQQIQDELVVSVVKEWASDDNPFNDIVWPESHVDKVASQMGQSVDQNDVKYVLKLTIDDYYFPKRGKSHRISKRAVDHAIDSGMSLPLDSNIQKEILKALKESEKNDVNHPEITHDELKSQLNYSSREIDFNLSYCELCSWVDVEKFIETNNWNNAEITSRGRSKV